MDIWAWGAFECYARQVNLRQLNFLVAGGGTEKKAKQRIIISVMITEEYLFKNGNTRQEEYD